MAKERGRIISQRDACPDGAAGLAEGRIGDAVGRSGSGKSSLVNAGLVPTRVVLLGLGDRRATTIRPAS
jgi:putative ribosome biogenesis GTPase RsgA